MRIKRLEVQGFKSFKDKTVIRFDDQITGIVGPNGCGKSNIVDAFFWVMGAQSYKNMRGASSDDLIFNGSTKHAPLGMAEATLVLETTEVDSQNEPAGASSVDVAAKVKTKEIAVTRRLYRSGEGEYFINGVPSRLKDILELFMDTGVGAKGYSVIEQGQIGKIVQSKPEERRLLIEEAAGIAKYKARKKESLRKIESAQANLSRLDDVLAEIERNLGSLERQAQKARQYKKYREELTEKEVTWGRKRLKALRFEFNALSQKRSILETELTELRSRLSSTENDIEVSRIEQLTISKNVDDLQADIDILAQQLNSQTSSLDLSRKRQADLERSSNNLKSERVQLEDNLQNAQTGVEEKVTLLTERSQELSEIDAIVEAAESELRIARSAYDDKRRARDDRERQYVDSIQQKSSKESKRSALQARWTAQEEKRTSLQEERSILEEKRLGLDELVRTAVEVLGQIEDEKFQASATLAERRTMVVSLEDAKRQLERTRAASFKIRAECDARIHTLKELDANLEGFSQGPRSALQWVEERGLDTDKNEWGTPVLIPIANRLAVKEGFERAVESALGFVLESMWTREIAESESLFREMSDQKLGRSNVLFSPSGDRVFAPDRETAMSILKDTGVSILSPLEAVIDIVEGTPEDLKKTVHDYASRFILVESLSDRAILSKLQARAQEFMPYVVVSREGWVLSSEGFLQGGQNDADAESTILGRKRVIEGLEEKLRNQDIELSKIDDEMLDIHARIQVANEERERAQESMQECEVKLATERREAENNKRLFDDLLRTFERSDRELERTNDEASRAEDELNGIESVLLELTVKVEDLASLKTEFEAEFSSLESQVAECDQVAQAHRMNRTTLREQVESLKRELRTLEMSLDERRSRLETVSERLIQVEEERSKFSGDDSGLETLIADLTKSLSEKRSEISVQKELLSSKVNVINSGIEDIKVLHKTGDLKNNEMTSLALEAERMQSDIHHLVQNLEEKYGAGCLSANVQAKPAEPLENSDGANDSQQTSELSEQASASMASIVSEQIEMDDPIVTAEMTAEEEKILNEEVEKLREKIKRLGEVNVMAIEEYEELNKRFEHLLKEKSDLVRSIENLNEAIEHINKTSELRFKAAYEAINERFTKLFPIIFGGGSAFLSLVYPEGTNDILEAGVDIMAQPPGKRVSNITLLSGGEKALTALALIFAIFMVKPSPFCILDEVDAPLDDANIGKFNALIREMSSKSQFILITHNKKTMEMNDSLYGVTMEDPGVSKMVSIELQ